MKGIVKTALRLGSLVLVVAGIVLVSGAWVLRDAHVDTLPEYLPPHVRVQTEALGLSAAEIEEFITITLEDDLNGVAFLDHLRSKSVPGLSSLELTFKPGTDIYKVRQLLTERVPPLLVNVGTPPMMIQPMSSHSRLMMVGLSSKDVSQLDLSTLARWRIKPRLLAVPGVANVTIFGQRNQQLQVRVDPKRLAEKGVTLDQVISTAGNSTWTSPLTFVEASSPGSDGLIDTPNQRLTVQHVLPIRTPKDLAAMPIVDTDGALVTLGDVATIVEDHPPLRGDAVLEDGTGLILVVEKFPDASTLVVTREVEAAIESLKPGLAGINVDSSLFRSATFIETAMRNIAFMVLASLLLVVAWLGIASRSWRAALAGGITIVLSFTVATLVLYAMDTIFSAVTLAGLVIALGVIVDDAVALTRVQRRVEEHAALDDSEPSGAGTDLVVGASVDVRRPFGYALAIMLLLAVPLLRLEEPARAFARPMMLAYLLALVASTLVATVVSPVLVAMLVRPVPGTGPGLIERWVRRTFKALISASVERAALPYMIAGALLLGGVVVLAQVSVDAQVPQMRDRNLLVQWEAIPGTSLTEMDRIVASASASLRAIDGVVDVGSHVGQALAGDQVVDVESAQTWITIDPKANYDRTTRDIERALANYVGLAHTLQTYRGRSLDDAQMHNGKAVTLRVYGNEQDVLEREGARAREWLAKVPGIANARLQPAAANEPVVRIRTDTAAAARYGLKPGDIRRQAAVLVGGLPVASYYDQQQIFDITVWSEPTGRLSFPDIAKLPLDTPTAGRIPLSAVAKVSMEPALTEINRDMASRYIDVTADAQGADLGSTFHRVELGLPSLALPLGYRADAFSDVQQKRDQTTQILVLVLVAAIGIYLVLQAAFASWRLAAIVYFTLPLTLVGAALAGLVASGTLTLGALIGLATVFTVTVRNEISLVQRFQELELEQPQTTRTDLVVNAASEASYPILLTAMALALAVMPCIVLGNVEGMEILRPFALAVIGGLVTATLFALLVLPALYNSLAKHAPEVSMNLGVKVEHDAIS